MGLQPRLAFVAGQMDFPPQKKVLSLFQKETRPAVPESVADQIKRESGNGKVSLFYLQPGQISLSPHDTFITASYLALIYFIFFFFLQTPAPEKDKAQAGPSKSPSLPEIKNKLSTAAKEVRLSSSLSFLQITALN